MEERCDDGGLMVEQYVLWNAGWDGGIQGRGPGAERDGGEGGIGSWLRGMSMSVAK